MKKLTYIAAITILFISFSNLTSENFDEYISRRIREDLYSPCMDKTMTGFTEIGSGEISMAILLSLYTFGNENVKESTKLATISIAGASIACALIKFTVNRERPYGDCDRINSSFPSGHATGAFAFTYVMSKRHPKTTIPLYFTASTIAFSRVYLGKHYLSDVITGSILGIATGWLIMKNEQTILNIKF